jgi:hypothetical protein
VLLSAADLTSLTKPPRTYCSSRCSLETIVAKSVTSFYLRYMRNFLNNYAYTLLLTSTDMVRKKNTSLMFKPLSAFHNNSYSLHYLTELPRIVHLILDAFAVYKECEQMLSLKTFDICVFIYSNVTWHKSVNFHRKWNLSCGKKYSKH